MDIDVSKENIQPLRSGRNLLQLGTALQAQSDVEAQRQLQLQKEEHETKIKNYQGSDPLDPWFNYIQWVEQSYPKHGHEGHIDKLIKDCLQLFEKNVQYYQDRRFVKLWIKYVDTLSDPLEMYQRLHNTGIGVECSEFYRAWACYCEESGDYKKANQIYMLGIEAKAQPIDELEQAHMNFQLFFAQRMLHDDSPTKRKAASALAETRMALTSLKTFKRRNIAIAPVQRIGDNIKNCAPGVVRQQANNQSNKTSKSNAMIHVYKDAPSTSQSNIPVCENAGPASLVQASNNLENEKEVGIWNNAKIKMVHANIVPSQQTLPFIPYEEEQDTRLPPNHMSYCVDDLSTFVVPLCVPDPPDATKIPSYNKSEVYVNKEEYSLEEIHSRKYFISKHKKTENSEMKNTCQPKNGVNPSLECSALETLANCALDAEQFSQLTPLAMPAIQGITKVTNMHSPGEPKVLVNLDSQELSQLTPRRMDDNKKSFNASHSEKQANVSNGSQKENNACKNDLMEEFNRSLMGNLLGDSVTVHTKEARWELRNIFNDNEPTIVQPPMQVMEMPLFDPCVIHEDKSMTMKIKTKKKQEVAAELCLPEEKENLGKFSTHNMPTENVNETGYYEEATCTQVFNFNIKNSSTPETSQFKKPTSCVDQQNKYIAVPKFNIDENAVEQSNQISKTDSSRQHAMVDNQGVGLSVIMESDREYTSKSGSSSSGQSMRTNFTGYTTPSCIEKSQRSNVDSIYSNQNDQMHPNCMTTKSVPQQCLQNGQIHKGYSKVDQPENKGHAPLQVQYFSHDHQYQKPVPQNFNGFTPQRAYMNYPQGYVNSQMINQPQQGYASPNAYHSPQHCMSPSVPAGFQSPPYGNQIEYHSPGHTMLSPQHSYPAPQEYHYSHQVERNPYNTPQQIYQSPPHQTHYPNQVYHRNSDIVHTQNPAYSQQSYNVSNQYQSPHVNTNNYQNYSSMQNQYMQPPKHVIDNVGYSAVSNQNFQIYQSPQQHPNNYRNISINLPQASPEIHKEEASKVNNKEKILNKEGNDAVSSKQPMQHSPSSTLRNIRQTYAKPPPGVGFSNQFLNFISNRNEPKDFTNTPKYSNSPSISQKMHKNLHVSSPEQMQKPQTPGFSDSDSKDSMTSVNMLHVSKNIQNDEKLKDISKRQLDFEGRLENHSEDSHDSIGKESRNSFYSRQSDFHSDGYGMDVDSENSMECGAFKSTHSISMLETSDIPRPADIDFPAKIEPFDENILASLLEYVKFPNKTHADGYTEVRSVPKLQTATVISIGNDKFSIEKQLGKGNYGAVFLALDLNTNKSVAIKYQKPSRPWEFYICQEIKARIKDPFMLLGYMDVKTAFLGENASLFVSEYSKYGSLLDVANKVRMATSKCINEYIVFLLTSEMLAIVSHLHKAQIIHADIKPDNFLLMKIPTQEWRTPSLQLIDMGRSIDMSLFPKETTFREFVSTEGFTCTEMREGKPWTYQTDLYCLAGTIHVILMGSYMKVNNRLGQWTIDKKLPRYMNISLWDKVFTTLLNVPNCENMPDLLELKEEVDNVLAETDSLGSQLRNLDNVLKSR